MSSHSSHSRHAGTSIREELLLDRAAQGTLSEQDAHALESIGIDADGVAQMDALAGLLFVGSLNTTSIERPPEALLASLRESGRRWCAQVAAEKDPISRTQSKPVTGMAATSAPLVLTRDAEATGPALDTSMSQRVRILPWLAAAAGIALAAFAWWRPVPPPTSPTPGLASAQVMLGELRRDQTALSLAWGDWDNPEIPGVKGEILWSELEQRGIMRFSNLPKLDESKERYQLWIIDSRGMEQRISGAIFNAREGEETLVAVDPGIPVVGAAAFAITIERPEGVWVSDMKRRVVIAAKG